MKDNILFTSAGDNTTFYNLWCSKNKNYDIFVCYYGDCKTDKYKEYSDFYLKRKGSKMQNFYHVWKNNINDIRNYKNYYIVDDDILIQTDEINELFKLFSDLNVWMLQPSFDIIKSQISHGITKQNKDSRYRYTNFIEINTPFFSNYAITECMKVYDPILVGYGIDILFLWALGMSEENKYVIVDYISCINPKRVKREINKLESESVRINKWYKIQEKFKIPNIKHKNFSIIR